EPSREATEDRVVRARVGELDGEPADLGLLQWIHRSVRRLRDELRAEADSQDRRVQIEQPLQEEVLLLQPGMMIVLVGVHRAAEDEHRAVCVERTGQRLAPGKAPLLEPVAALADDVAEHARAHARAMDDCQHLHQLGALTGTFSACSNCCSCFAFAAACAMRPPLPSELVALLLKNAYACSACSDSSRSGRTHSRSSSSEYR